MSQIEYRIRIRVIFCSNLTVLLPLTVYLVCLSHLQNDWIHLLTLNDYLVAKSYWVVTSATAIAINL